MEERYEEDELYLDRDDLWTLADIVDAYLQQQGGRTSGREVQYPRILRVMSRAMLHDDYIKTTGSYVGTTHG